MRHGHFDSDEISGRHLDWRLFRRFVGLVIPYRVPALFSLLLLPAIAASKLVQPYLLKLAIDRHILPAAWEGIGRLAAYFAAAVLIESLLLFIQSYLVQAVGQRLMADLRRDGMRTLLRLPTAYFDRNPSGRLVTRMTSDVENVGELFGAGVVSSLGDLLTLAGIVAAMLWLDVKLSLVSFAILPGLVLMVLLFRRHMRQATRQVRARLASLNAYVAERIGGIDEVRIFGQEERTEAEFAALQGLYRDSTFRMIGWDALLYAVVEALAAVTIAALLWWGGGEVMHGVVTFGTLVAFTEYVTKFFAPLRDLSAKYSVIQASHASLERIFELLDQPTEPLAGTGLPPAAKELVCDRLSFSYDGRTPVLNEISFTLPPGGRLAVVGATGSGKTTLGRLLLGFYPPGAGEIRLAGASRDRVEINEWRRAFGWVGQEPFLFSGTLRDNLDPRQLLSDRQLLELADRVGVRTVIDRLGGLDVVIRERGGNLSAGERQLFCLLRALVPGPAILLLDEATSRLDVESERLVQQGLQAVAGECSQLIIAHRLRTITSVDRILVLHRGRLRESGTHAELLAANGIYARMWRLQELGFAARAADQGRQ